MLLTDQSVMSMVNAKNFNENQDQINQINYSTDGRVFLK
jgi:hypothetical protein